MLNEDTVYSKSLFKNRKVDKQLIVDKELIINKELQLITVPETRLQKKAKDKCKMPGPESLF